jgi:hypothetical protein
MEAPPVEHKYLGLYQHLKIPSLGRAERRAHLTSPRPNNREAARY